MTTNHRRQVECMFGKPRILVLLESLELHLMGELALLGLQAMQRCEGSGARSSLLCVCRGLGGQLPKLTAEASMGRLGQQPFVPRERLQKAKQSLVKVYGAGRVCECGHSAVARERLRWIQAWQLLGAGQAQDTARMLPVSSAATVQPDKPAHRESRLDTASALLCSQEPAGERGWVRAVRAPGGHCPHRGLGGHLGWTLKPPQLDMALDMPCDLSSHWCWLNIGPLFQCHHLLLTPS